MGDSGLGRQGRERLGSLPLGPILLAMVQLWFATRMYTG